MFGWILWTVQATEKCSQRQMASGLQCPLLAALALQDTHAGKGSMPHHGSASLALGARPTTNSHCSEKGLLQLHTQDIACCQVPGPGNAAEVANTSTGKETTEQMLNAARAVGHTGRRRQEV